MGAGEADCSCALGMGRGMLGWGKNECHDNGQLMLNEEMKQGTI